MENLTPDESAQPLLRSTFVTVLAWIFIALSGFATLISILQNLMIWLVFPRAEMKAAQAKAATDGAPAFASWMFGHMEFWFAGFLLVCVVALISAIGLLRRKNWARMVFIALMGVGIAFNLVAIPMQWLMMKQVPKVDNPQMANFDTMMTIMQVFSTVFVVGFCILLGWIIKRLISPAINSEFGQT